MTKLARLYSMKLNGMIATAVNDVEYANKNKGDLSIKFFDLFYNLHSLMADPAAYGLPSNLIRDTSYGERGANNRFCTEPEKYVYYDLNHSRVR